MYLFQVSSNLSLFAACFRADRLFLGDSHPMSGDPYGTGRGQMDGIAGVRMVARQYISAEFRGKNAHAGGNPWKGVNALDSAVASYNNISLLRQQIAPNERIHIVVLDSEKTVNVIPAYAKVAYQTRSPRLTDLKALTERVTNCIKAAALATGTEVKIQKYVTYIWQTYHLGTYLVIIADIWNP